MRCDQCTRIVVNRKNRGRWQRQPGRSLPWYVFKRIGDYVAGCANCGGHTGTYA